MEVQQPSINWDATSLADEWNRFEQHARLMLIGPLAEKTEKSQCAYLLIWMGEKGQEIFNTFEMEKSEANKIGPLIKNFKDDASPKKNTVFARYIFQKKDQLENESIERYITELKTLAKPCLYTEQDEMIRDQIVCGIRNQAVREKLLAEGDPLTLESAVSRCRTYKTTHAQLKSFSGSKPISIKQEVNAITRGPSRNSFRNQKASVNNHTKGREYYFCGGSYSTNHACPAKEKICTQCKKPNHLARVCRSNKNVNTIDEETESFREAVDDQETIFLYAIDKSSGKDEALVALTLNNQLSVNFKIDTGAQANVIPKNIFDKIQIRKDPAMAWEQTSVVMER
ncbi:uncharacterized protein LOC136032586 [Artemia franciscana]|uniref:uncharacterized protein LOC136032586 n=1 Tax=Artemia franciscana TaxID=6661 RepID=UPI0032D9D6F4